MTTAEIAAALPAHARTSIDGLPFPLLASGKVREIFDLADALLLVATDRLSAFDVVMAEPVPDKGRVLTAMSAFWFEHLADVVPNHVVSYDVEDLPDEWRGRSMLVRRAEMLPVAGSA